KCAIGSGEFVSVQPLEDSCGALTAAYTHGDHAVARVPAFHLLKESRCELGAGASEWMAKGDGTAIDVYFFGIEAELADHCESLSGEGFVELDQLDVVELEAGFL